MGGASIYSYVYYVASLWSCTIIVSCSEGSNTVTDLALVVVVVVDHLELDYHILDSLEGRNVWSCLIIVSCSEGSNPVAPHESRANL